MIVSGIDAGKCIRCGECIKDCPPRLYKQEAARAAVLFTDPWQRCIRCGHCIAVCKPAAILYESTEQASEPGDLVPYDTVFDFLAMRRSVRRYKQQPVAAEDLQAVFRAMQYAPSASNARSWQYIALTSPEKRAYLAAQTVRMFKVVHTLLRLRWLLAPFLPKYLKRMLFDPGVKDGIAKTLADFNSGKDVIFFNAPCVILLYAPVYGKMAGNDAGIALTYGMLAAQARGLGSCWVGFAQEALLRNRALARRLAIPQGRQVCGVLALGYPAVRYYHVPPREQVPVKYM